MKKLKTLSVILLSFTLVFGVIGCGNKSNADNAGGTEGTKELKTVTIANPALDGTLTEAAGIAQREGYFEEELAKVGYKPDYQGFAQAGPAINEAFAAKSLDFAVYGDMPAITAKSNGVDVKIIASVSSQQDYAIVIGNQSDISSISDLKGKKIAVGFGTVTYKYLEDLLGLNGLGIGDVEIVNTSVDGPTMLSSGQVDAFVTQLTAAYLYQQSKIGKIFVSTKDTPEIAGQFVLAVRGDFLQENPEAAQAVVKALNRAYEFAKGNTDKVYEDLATKNFPSSIQKVVYSDTSFEYFDPAIDSVTEKKLTDLKEYLKKNKLIANDVDINQLIDKSVYEKAVQ